VPVSAYRRAPLPCEADPDLFFPVSTVGPSITQIAHAQAKCARCPIIDQCRTAALERGEATLCIQGGVRIVGTTPTKPEPGQTRTRRKDAALDPDDYQFLRSFGASKLRLADRLGIKASSLDRAEQRWQQDQEDQCASQHAATG